MARKNTPHRALNPAGWKAPDGRANGLHAEGACVFVGGQYGWNRHQEFETDDLVGQIRQSLHNIVEILAEAGASPEHVVRMTWYLTDGKDYRARREDVDAIYQTVMGRHFPAVTVVQVAALMDERALVSIEATAVVPA